LKALGVVVEYNPFHNGHHYHLEAAKQACQPDVVVAVMSGNFLQRGEPALINKWYRAKMALLGGVDIVIELPYRFATQKAETFALGAVSILNDLNCNYLCFGSEHGDIQSFLQTRKWIEENDEEYQLHIREYMKAGVSYPKALNSSFLHLGEQRNLVDLSKPNNILGYHYIEAIEKLQSHMVPFTIKRKNAEYHDEHFTSETIASATSIRKALFSSESETEIDRFVPITTKELLNDYLKAYQIFHNWENYWPLLRYRIIQAGKEELQQIYEVEEGLENRFKKIILQAHSFYDFMERIKTKRYTWTRLQRACLHILTNSKKEDIFKQPLTPTYLRLLGMTDSGQKYLSAQKKQLSVPIISKLSTIQDNFDLHLDIKAAQVYSLGLHEPFQSKLLELEYKQHPILVKEKR
jgi:predicted nucleotidyltransferase